MMAIVQISFLAKCFSSSIICFLFFFPRFSPRPFVWSLVFGGWGAFLVFDSCAVPNGVRHHLPLVLGAEQETGDAIPTQTPFFSAFLGGASPTSWPHGGQSQEAAPHQCTTSDIIGFGALASLKFFFGRQSPTQNALRRPFWL